MYEHEDFLPLHRDVATLLVEVKHVREVVGEVKESLKEELPSMRSRITALELEGEKMKVRIATAGSIGAAVGGVVLFLLQKVFP